MQPGNTANTTPWLAKISDGTNAAAIKAASTAAVAADPALVVAISPNNTVPVSLASVPTHGVTGTFWQATQPVSIATTVPITDNSGSITVDAPVGTPAFVRLSDGTAAISTLPVSIAASVAVTGPLTDTQLRASAVPVSLASVPSHAVTNVGTFAVQASGIAANGAAVSGNPLLIAGSDGTLVRTVKTATDGTLLVNGVQDARQTGSITTATSVVGPFSVSNRNVVTVAVFGTHAGVTFVIEATDDNTNWYGLQSINNATGQASSSWTIPTNGSASYDSAVGGYTQIRVRATAWTSGTMTIGVSTQVFAYDPVVAALSQGLAATGAALVGNPVLIGGSDGTNARNLSTNTSGHINIADGGNSITVDGTVGISGTVPVSIATMPSTPVTGTFWQATQPVSIATMPSTPVTGTFWQATQPVSIATTVPITDNSGSITVDAPVGTPAFVRLSDGTAAISTLPVSIAASVAVTGPLTDTQLRATAVPVSAAQTGTWTVQPGNTANTTPWLAKISDGTNAAAIKAASTAAVAADPALVVAISPNNTVPVSLASVPTHGVTGTFWQATQPVSIATMPSTPVTGTFWQATQPVSIATTVPITDNSGSITVDAPVGTPAFVRLSDGTAAISTLPVSIAATLTTKGQALTNNSTTAYATSLIIKASAGSLYIITGFNSKTTDQFIQLHDSATLPADTAIPKVIFRVAAGSNFSFDLGIYGRVFTSGIVVCNSSTGPTKTIGAADCWFDCQYI